MVHPRMSWAKLLDPHVPTHEGCSPDPSNHRVVQEQPQPGWGRGGPTSPGSSGLVCWLPMVLPRDRSPKCPGRAEGGCCTEGETWLLLWAETIPAQGRAVRQRWQ